MQRTLNTIERRRSRRGFTVVEILVVVALVILLLGITALALNKASGAAKAARTRTLMQSINQALVTFENDHGYLPPVLDNDRGLSGLTFPSMGSAPATRLAELQDWYSVTTLADFLLGYDSYHYDGYGDDDNPGTMGHEDEVPALGIRTPGSDGLWGGTFDTNGDGSLTIADREPKETGKVFSPYLQLKDERLIGSINPTDTATTTRPLTVSFPGDPGYMETNPKVIADYWGNPIRYYRKLYPSGAIKSTIRPTATMPAPTLGDVFVLRPYDLKVGEGTSRIDSPDEDSDVTSSHALDTASFATFSPGADTAFDVDRRVDGTEFNVDNIVELGG